MSKFTVYGLLLQILLFPTLLANEANSQARSIENIRISVTFNNDDIEKAFTKIEALTDFYFAYKSNLIDKSVLINKKIENESIADVLRFISKNNKLQFKRVGNNILVDEMSKSSFLNSSLSVQETLQDITVTGRVVSEEDGEGLPGANVIIKGTTTGTVTDIDGRYALNVPSEESVLVFSSVGFISEEVTVGKRSVIDISLIADIQSLLEVVVIGYGAVKKEDLTGAVASIGAETITKTTVTDATGALQGRIAGVNIQKKVGRPGSGFDITVRGLSSLNNSNAPLFVIDGIPTTSGMTDLNPHDIQKIDVLKDASATAIYGSRGANGVVIVTTKKGKEGKLTIQYDANYGVRAPTNLPDMMSGEEYVEWKRYTDPDYFNAAEQDVINRGAYTDWVDLILRNGMQYSNTITASGGNEKGTFALSVGQLKEEGTVPGQDYNRYNLRLNLNRKFAEKWEAGGNIYLSYSVQNEGSFETLRSAYRMPPIASPYDENGEPIYTPFREDYLTSPLFEFTDDGELRERRRYRVFGNVYLQVEPLEGLTLRSQLSPQIIYDRRGEYYGMWAKNGGHGSMAAANANYLRTDQFGYVLDNLIGYQKNMGLHNLNFTFIQSIQYEQWEEGRQAGRDFPYNSKWYNMDAAATTMLSETDYRQLSLASFTGRLEYGFKDKYLFTATGRYDGSSRLSPGNKWAFFPSAAFAWKVSEENFMQGLEQVDNLKLRLSYGVTGNDVVDIYGTQANTEQWYYDFGGEVSPSFYKERLANPNLSWEKTSEFNLGLDYGIFNYRIGGSVDVYRRDSKDLIMKRQLPQTSGWVEIWDNVGWVRNTGIELAINTLNIETSNFSWTTDLIFDTNKNEIIELYGEKNDDVGSGWFIGQPIRVNYDWEFDGIWQQNEADLAAEYGQSPGQVKVRDLDNNRIINAADRKIIGQQTPKWTGSITNTLNYKNWDFSVYLYTRQGQQLFSTFVSSFMALKGEYNNVDVDYWTENDPSNEYPEPGNEGIYFKSMQYQDVSFVRVGNVSLGYSFPEEWMNRLHVNKLRLYATAVNPLVFTSYPGYDPEWAQENTWGEATSYATYLLGINLEF